MPSNSEQSRRPYMVWVCPDSLIESFNAYWMIAITRELRVLGWQVLLISAGPPGYRTILGVETVCVSSPNIYLLRQFIFHFQSLKLIWQDRASIDVIYFNQLSFPFLLPLKIWRELIHKKTPLLVLDTRTVPMELKERANVKDKLRGAYTNYMNWMANLWADGQTAITQYMATAVRIPDYQLWGIWPSGVDSEPFMTALNERRWPRDDEPVHIIYIGILHYERNLMTLCRAAELANAEGMNFTVTFVGEGTEQADLEEFAKNTDGWVRVLPPVPHDQIPGVLSQAHVGALIFPDEPQFRVSSPIKLFEYMAAGLPILATRIVCHTDVVKDGSFAFWAEDSSTESVKEALLNIWKNRAALSIMGKEAANAAQFWTWAKSAEKLKSALELGLQKRSVNATASLPTND